MKNSYNFFKNIDCKYYPCHKGIKVINCLFCYCPLYFLKDCGGNYILNQKGIKDCSNCIIPHVPVKGYKYINKKLKNKKMEW